MKAARALALLGALLGAPAFAATGLLVPANFYPSDNSFWADMNSAAASVPLTAILNPDSGPGTGIDPVYTGAIEALHSAGGSVIGYVATGYGNRSATAVKQEIDDYLSFYDVDGIFLDEMDNTQNKLTYYQALHDYIKAKPGKLGIVGNPGINTLEGYLAVADTLVTFENPATAYGSYETDPWTSAESAGRFAHIIYSETGSAAMQQALALARQRNAGWVFVTNDGGSNPYDTLPSYWNSEVQAIAAQNADSGGNEPPPPASGGGDTPDAEQSSGGAWCGLLLLLPALWRRRNTRTH